MNPFDEDAPSALHQIFRELPRRRVLLVVLVVLLNLAFVVIWGGHRVAVARSYNRGFVFNIAVEYPDPWVPPWDWSSDEWRQVAWPWK